MGQAVDGIIFIKLGIIGEGLWLYDEIESAYSILI